MERGYQAGFYTLSESVRNPDIRQRKAEKILWALTTFTDQPLSSLICLDVGCSSGMMTASIAPLFRYTLGMDYDAIALSEIAPSDQAKADFARSDAMQLPIADASIDVVICAQVYEHVPSDKALFDEIYRVLKPGGMVFFSGPNWLFPIEPHYFLPFLHWLPASLADRYLQLSGMGEHYYERLRHIWGLRTLLRRFVIQDIAKELLSQYYFRRIPFLYPLLAAMPTFFWHLIDCCLPNFNWILRKPNS